jgi:hypothetical protein
MCGRESQTHLALSHTSNSSDGKAVLWRSLTSNEIAERCMHFFQESFLASEERIHWSEIDPVDISCIAH